MRGVVIVFVMILLCCCNSRKSVPYTIGVDSIPSINIQLIDSVSVVNTIGRFGGSKSVFVFFEPYCPYCRREIMSILDNINRFDDVHFLFLTVAPYRDMKLFYEQQNIEKYRNITVGRDTGVVYMTYFNTRTVPHTSVYNKKGILKDVFPSMVDASRILSSF